MKDKFINYYMDVAKRTALLSYAEKLKVGSIIVKEDRIISIGYNGTPSGFDNVAEYVLEDGSLKTKDETIHAEMNAISKLAKSSESGFGAVMFITHSPCIQCSKGIYSSGIKEVYYSQEYRDPSGLKFLEKCGIKVERVL
jgi:dCMP deaminase|nr:MAG: dCMP deaminase [Caudoviricetes sp.]